MSALHVLGLDPGFANIGIAVVRIDGDRMVPVYLDVLRTSKSDAKRQVRASEDNFDRAKDIAATLRELAVRYDVRMLTAETMSFPRNASVAAKMAMCWGVIAALADGLELPLAQASPQEIKKAVCGNKSASKEDVVDAVRKLFPESTKLLERVPASLIEHPYDALASVVACSHSELFTLARKVTSCAESTR